MILCVFMISPIMNKRYHAAWRFNFWKVFTLFLIIPVGLILRLVISSEKAQASVTAIKNHAAAVATVPVSAEPVSFQMIADNQHASIWTKLIETGPQWIPIIWIIGVCVVAIYLVSVYLHFTHTMKKNSKLIQSEYMNKFQVEILSRHKGKKPLPIYEYSRIASPMIAGIIRPAIFIPKRDYTMGDLQIILTHELTHYLRNDLKFKGMFILALILHWYNPFVYMMTKVADKDMELCCDRDAIKEKDQKFRSAYSDVIMGEIISRRQQTKGALFACMGSDKKTMEERLKNIFSSKKKKGGICFLAALILAVAISGFAYASDYNVTDFDSNPELQKLIDEAILTRQANTKAAFAEEAMQGTDREHMDIPNFDELVKQVEDEEGNFDLLDVYKLAGVEPPDYDSELDLKSYESYYNLISNYIEPHILGNGERAVYSTATGKPWELKKGDIVKIHIFADIDRLDPDDYVYMNGQKFKKIKGYLTLGYINKYDKYVDVRQKFKINEEEQIEFEIPENGTYNFYLFCPSSSDIIIKLVSIDIK